MSLNYVIYALLASQAFAFWPFSQPATRLVSEDTQKSSDQPASLLDSHQSTEMTRENIRQTLASVEDDDKVSSGQAASLLDSHHSTEMSREDIRHTLASVQDDKVSSGQAASLLDSHHSTELTREDIRHTLASVQDDKASSGQSAILLANQDTVETHAHNEMSSDSIRQVLAMVQSDGNVGGFNSGFTRSADVGSHNFTWGATISQAESGPKKCRKCMDIGRCLGDMLPTMLKPHFEMDKKSFNKATSNLLFVSMMENMVYTCDVSDGEDCHSSEQASLITTEKDMIDKILCKNPCTFELWKVEHNCGSQFDYNGCKALIADQERLGSQAKMNERSSQSKEVMEALTQQLDTTASHKCD